MTSTRTRPDDPYHLDTRRIVERLAWGPEPVRLEFIGFDFDPGTELDLLRQYELG